MLPALLNLVGSTCLLVWTIALLSQWILRRRADRAGARLPLRMWAFPYVTWLGLAMLGAIFVLAMCNEGPRMQLLSTIALTLAFAACSAVARRMRGAG